MSEGNGAPARGTTPPPPSLRVGGLVAGGRYELLEAHGGRTGQSFWRAHDKRLGRDVALTFVDPLPGETPPGSATGVLDRTVALTGVYSDGLARVLDVIRGRAGGIVVSEWVPGRSLAAAVAEPRPDSAVGAVWGLADAATRAETAGLVLGLDSPDRIRVTEDGRALLAFAGVGSEADTRADVRGLGAVLYALLAGTWPVPLPPGSGDREPRDGRPPAAETGTDGTPVDPARGHPDVPQDSAVLARRSLDGTTVSSAATVRAMVTDRTGGPVHAPTSGTAGTASRAAAPVAGGAAASSSSSSPTPSPGPGPTPGTDPADPGPSADHAPGPYVPPDEHTQKRRWMIMAGVSAVAVIAVVLLGVWMLGALSGDDEQVPLSQQLDAIERQAQQSREAEASAAAAEESGDGENGSGDAEQTSGPAEPEPTTPVAVADVTSWQPADSNGTAENSASAPDVVDDDPDTGWASDTYRSQIGDGPSAFKPGIGLMFSLEQEEETGRVVVHSDDDGVRFEVRSSPSADPDALGETELLGTATVRDGSGTATISTPEPSERLLVWIDRLGTTGPQAFRAEISEVELTR